MTRFTVEAEKLTDRHRAESVSSARALLTTVFGDSLRPRAQAISVQDLAGLVEPMGVNERLVRTSLHRITNEGLVVGDRVGRRSFYSVAPEAVDTFASAEQRFYTRHPIEWDGLWTLVVIDPSGADSDGRTRLARELGWLGMRAILSGVLASPTLDPAIAHDLAERLDVPVAFIVRGPLSSGTFGETHTMTSLDEPEAELHELYGRHIDEFTSIAAAAKRTAIAPPDAFVVRTLLIESWRRIALRSTDLPAELLPNGWRADEAYDLTARLYRTLQTPSEAHLDAVLGYRATTATARFTED